MDEFMAKQYIDRIAVLEDKLIQIVGAIHRSTHDFAYMDWKQCNQRFCQEAKRILIDAKETQEAPAI